MQYDECGEMLSISEMIPGIIHFGRVAQEASPLGSEILQELSDPMFLEPVNLVECLPQFAGFVDINLACLLGVCLSELFVDAERVETLHEDSTFRREIGCTVKAKIGGKRDLIRVEQVCVRIVPKIDGSPLPVDLERVWFVGEAGDRWAVIRQGREVLVLACNSLRLSRRLAHDGTDLWLSRRLLNPSSWSRYRSWKRSAIDVPRSGCDSRVSSGTHSQGVVLLQICQLSGGPETSIGVEDLGHLRFEFESELVFLFTRRRCLSEHARFPRPHMLVYHPLCIVICEERRLR